MIKTTTKARETFETPVTAAKFELKPRAAGAGGGSGAAPADQLPMLCGYAIVWNATSSLRVDPDTGEQFYARFQPGSIKFEDPTQAIYAHDSKQVLGSTANGTLRIISDEVGARVEMDLPNTTYARDVAELVKGKYVNGMSWGGFPTEYDKLTETGADGQPMNIRSYRAGIGDEVTVTGVPAFVQTTIDALYARDSQAVQLEELQLAMTHFEKEF